MVRVCLGCECQKCLQPYETVRLVTDPDDKEWRKILKDEEREDYEDPKNKLLPSYVDYPRYIADIVSHPDKIGNTGGEERTAITDEDIRGVMPQLAIEEWKQELRGERRWR